SGKTRRAVSIASNFNGEIISADSRPVYRDMTLGTGKDLEEYGNIPYHLIDICDAGEKYNLYQYLRDFHIVYTDIKNRNKFPVICGGSGMYVENALNGIHLPNVPQNLELRDKLKDKSLEELTEILKRYKQLHNTTDVDTVKRALRAIEIEEYYLAHPLEAEQSKKEKASPLNTLVIGLDIPREDRRKSISKRLQARLDNGMIEEIEGLLKKGINPEDLIYYGLEYKYLTLYVIGKITFSEMFKSLETAIHQFAKRQMTWFRGMEKRGIPIKWVPYNLSDEEFSEFIKGQLI
ncbi:MAG: tRNA (adenosine(37)-N6)-dimethylallyltransferase MiaA, partial [Muribaculaceae bacterium]|nr:tRNA (adenosine(37)-N6)-dimethylallyltransferase MiaA [Muribaculaceae bacterium]